MIYEEKTIETIPVGPIRTDSVQKLFDPGCEGKRLAGRVEKGTRE